MLRSSADNSTIGNGFDVRCSFAGTKQRTARQQNQTLYASLYEPFVTKVLEDYMSR